jgi:uridine kinase
MTRPYVIGVAGGSGSGKTAFAACLARAALPLKAGIISLDSYYRSRAHLSVGRREEINYDHPDAVEFELLLKHLSMLAAGASIEMPVYDFAAHLRSSAVRPLEAAPLVIIEGIGALLHAEVREFMELKIFIDAPAELRLQRRLARDVKERGRSAPCVMKQWRESVYPMHMCFYEDTKRYADRVIRGEGEYRELAAEIIGHSSICPLKK